MASIGTTNFATLDIDLYTPAILPDPWPVLARIREAGLLVWNEQGYWMSAHDRVCRRVLTQPEAMDHEGLIRSFFGEEAFITIDERPLHNALRNVWVSAFGHGGVQKLVPVVRGKIAEMLDGIEDRLRAGDEVDIVPALCRPLPAWVIAHMMGVSQDMTPHVIGWADAMASATIGGLPIDYDNDPYWLASERAKAELADYIIDQLRYRRTHSGEDLISRIVQSEIGRSMSEQAMMVNIRQLLFAGNETTSNWLGHIFVTLGTRDVDRRALAADPALIPAAAEEVLRWQGVTQVMPRTVTSGGAEVAGQHLDPGTEIILLLGAAGRDPVRWDQPDVFDIRRKPLPHLAFGNGLHSCLGAILARMEAAEATGAVLDRFPEYRLSRPVEYTNFSLRGPAAVWIELCA